MTKDDALQFLREHQPLPSDAELTEDVIVQFDEIRKFFSENPDPACVSLFLNSFGDGSGFGVYQLVERTLQKQDRNLVIRELKSGLRSPRPSVRGWCAEISAGFADECLIPELSTLLQEGDYDTKYAAVTALEQIGGESVKSLLQRCVSSERDTGIATLIGEVLESI